MSLPHPRAWRACCGALVFSLAFAAPALAQTVTGVVVDAATGESLIGVNVQAFPAGAGDMAVGAATDLDGRYRLTGLAPGTYDLVLSYVGYHARRVTGLALAAGATVTLDVPLEDEAIEVGEAVVEARALRDSGAALLRERQRAAAVSDALAADEIGRSGASNAGDAMQRVTGASVVDGRYVVMRGLSGRYLNVQLNGALLPSADPDRNAVPLDLFPSGLLDNIVTAKTFTPDQPGDFTGGSVNLSTRAFPERLTATASVSTSFSTNVTPGGDLLYVPGGRLGLLGAPESDLALPAAVAEGDIPALSLARNDDALAARLDAASSAFAPVMGPGLRSAPVNQSLSLSVGNQVPVLGRPLGFVAGLSWSRDYDGYTGGVVQAFSGQGTGGEVTRLVREYVSSPDEAGLSGTQSGAEEVALGALAHLSYRLSDRSEVGLNLLYNASDRAEALYRTGRFADGTLAPDAVLESRSLLYVSRALASAQVRGAHALDARGRRVEWNASAARTTQAEPDYRVFNSHYRVSGADTLHAIAPAAYPSPTRYFRDLTENAYNGTLDLTLPARVLGRAARFKVGGAAQHRARDFRERSFQLLADETAYGGDPAFFFGPENAGIVGQDEYGRYRFGSYVADATSPQADYDGTLHTLAGYAMVDLDLTARLRLVTGARVEASRTAVAPVNLDNPTLEGDLDDLDVLPSANVVYALTEAMNLRAAYGRTLARPSFRELAPYATYELRNNRTFVGNPDLERTRVDNFDLRWEWFTRPAEVLAVSAFAKRFDAPIELTYNVSAVNPEVQPRNLSDATVLGLEFEARRRLDALPGPLANLTVGGNLTLARSAVTIREDERARRLDPTQQTRPLQGQSPFLVNLDLGYTSPDGATAVNVLYNLFGRRLDAVSIGRTPDVFEDARGVLDLTASRRLGRGLTLRAAARNLLGAPYRLVQTFEGEDYVTEEVARGRAFSVGVAFGL